LDRQAVALVDRKRDEQLDAVFEGDVAIAEGAPRPASVPENCRRYSL
jgi:hypothetical protein